MTLENVAPEPEISGPRSDEPPRPNHQARFIRYLHTAQRYSAYGISVFAGLHLTTTIVLPAISQNVADSAFMATRSIYQSEVGELLLVYGSFGVHVASGLVLHGIRIYNQYTRFGRVNFGKPSKTAVSGLFLTALASLHFIGTRVGPLVKLGDSSLISLDYISWTLQHHLLTTGGSLTALAALFSIHASAGFRRYFHLRFSEAKQYLYSGAFTMLAIASLACLAKRPQVSGWLASQFELGQTFLFCK